MRVYLISGDGNGAGKSTLARKLAGEVCVCSLAAPVRHELNARYPGYAWFSGDSAYKRDTRVREAGNRTVREALVWWAEERCATNPTYYAEKLVAGVRRLGEHVTGVRAIAVDDVRKVVELEHLRAHFPDVVHFHVLNPDANAEPEFDNGELAARADYIITWRK